MRSFIIYQSIMILVKKGDPKNFAKFTENSGLRSFGERVSITQFKLAFSFDYWFHRNEIKKNSI